jgi:hypothetical protein
VYGTAPARAALAATSSIPVFAISVGDPVRARLVEGLAHPGGNLTGNTVLGPDIGAKRLGASRSFGCGLLEVARPALRPHRTGVFLLATSVLLCCKRATLYKKNARVAPRSLTLVSFRLSCGRGVNWGRAMIRIIIDAVLFSCMGAFIAEIVVAAATFIS